MASLITTQCSSNLPGVSSQVALVTSTAVMAMEETIPRWTGGETKTPSPLHSSR